MVSEKLAKSVDRAAMQLRAAIESCEQMRLNNPPG
jgi:hypothetical protein